MRRSRMIGYAFAAIVSFGFSCGAGIYLASDIRMVHIIELSERNRILIDSMKEDARELERQAAMIHQRCGLISLKDEQQ